MGKKNTLQRNNTGMICWNYTLHIIFGMYCAAVRRLWSSGDYYHVPIWGTLSSVILFKVLIYYLIVWKNTIVNPKCDRT